MMKTICLSFLFLCVIGCKKEVKNLPEDFDFGDTKKNTYTNSYFGLTFDYPEGWSVQSKHNIQAITEKGEKYLAREHTKMGAILKASQINTAYLFSIFRYPIKEPKGYNASLSVIAENVYGNPEITRGRDYLFNSRELLKETPAGFKFEEDFDTKSLGGETFDVMRAKVTFGDYPVEQEFFCIVRQGFSLSFILSYSNEEEKAVLYKIMDSIDLHKI